MNFKAKTIRFLVVLLFFIFIGLIFRFAIQPFLSTWGSSDEIAEMALPGDSLVSSPSYVATRTITIAAKPWEIYPWLVQMGKKKAGMYGWDWFNNGFKQSSYNIIPAYQKLDTGDVVRVRTGLEMEIQDFKKDTFIVWKGISKSSDASVTWMLTPSGKRETKLVCRMRIKYHYVNPVTLINLGYEIVDMPLNRASLKGIQNRAEALGQNNMSTEIARAVLLLFPLLAMFIFLLRVFKKEKYWEPLYMVGIMLVFFLFLLYVSLPMWVLVIVAFIVLLTLIGTAAESAALKQQQSTENQTT
ncbi:hypothetical protein ACE01N_08900 [Saccharicrinis sp. FJH2]|uniref:hypothetical protein n=1 Tax=Saccharicrinis sp. FJH65 TaxID=3344659 RepID=UPI0035F361F3